MFKTDPPAKDAQGGIGKSMQQHHLGELRQATNLSIDLEHATEFTARTGNSRPDTFFVNELKPEQDAGLRKRK
ncbi:hypothetical protein [Pseudomonas sp. PA1(2017)]|uniref:hypothetical protein n=1 Tax=Pseudomonas sp. PA1(2017) TaxID=1932113 RepID=UPI0011152C8F|nr:hypothetical protein [Pseudomonas sp. PA1(2017)]